MGNISRQVIPEIWLFEQVYTMLMQINWLRLPLGCKSIIPWFDTLRGPSNSLIYIDHDELLTFGPRWIIVGGEYICLCIAMLGIVIPWLIVGAWYFITLICLTSMLMVYGCVYWQHVPNFLISRSNW